MTHLRGLREDRVEMALARALAAELQERPARAIAKARHNLSRQRRIAQSTAAHEWLDRWGDLLDGSPAEIIELILSDTEYAHDMRQMAPFAGVVAPAVRVAAIRQARDEAHTA